MLSTVSEEQRAPTLQLFQKGNEEIILRNDAEGIFRHENFPVDARDHLLYLFLGMTRAACDDT